MVKWLNGRWLIHLYLGWPQINRQFINNFGMVTQVPRTPILPHPAHHAANSQYANKQDTHTLSRTSWKIDRPTCRVHLLFMSSYQHQTMSDQAFCVDNNNNNNFNSNNNKSTQLRRHSPLVHVPAWLSNGLPLTVSACQMQTEMSQQKNGASSLPTGQGVGDVGWQQQF